MKRSMIRGCLPAFLLLLALPTMAQDGRLGRPTHGGRGAGPGQPPIEKMLERLDLSESQRAEIDALLEEAHDASGDKMKQLRQRHDDMKQLLQAEEIDESQYRALALEAAELEADLALGRVETTRRVKAQLTPEQQEEAQKMMERRQGMNRRGPVGRGAPRPGQRSHPDTRDLE